MDDFVTAQFRELESDHWWLRARERIFFHLISALTELRQDGGLLEIGCGAGGMLAPLGGLGKTTGVDIDARLVAFCHAREFDRTLVADGTELPFAEASFQFAAFFDCLEHIPDDQAALAAAYRVLEPGGYLFVTVPAYQFLYANQDRWAGHVRRYTRGLLTQRLKMARFTIQKATYFNTLLFPAILPAVLLIKLRERFFDTGQTRKTNLSYRYPPLLARLLEAVLAAERHLLVRANLPVGHSLIAIARK
jgi:SAM-dependent methyltransferase